MRCNIVNIIPITDMHYGSEFQDQYYDNGVQYIIRISPLFPIRQIFINPINN